MMATIVINIAYPNPVLCIALIMIHIMMRAMINPIHPGKKYVKRNSTTVIKKEVRKTLPKFVFLAFLKKLNEIFKKIVMIMSNTTYSIISIKIAPSSATF